MTTPSSQPHEPLGIGVPGRNLRKEQKNTLIQEISRLNHEPANFKVDGPSWASDKLRQQLNHSVVIKVWSHYPKGRFVVAFDDPLEDAYDGPFTVKYTPHYTRLGYFDEDVQWLSVVEHYRGWLGALTRESVPDLWAEHQRGREIEDAVWEVVREDYDHAFTNDEIKQLSIGFAHAANQFKLKRLLSPADQAELETGLQQQVTAAGSRTKIQWSQEFLKWWIPFYMAKLANSALAQQAWDIMANTVEHVWYGITLVGDKIRHLIPPHT